MNTPLRGWIVEDSEDDLLLVRKLRRGGYDLNCERVDTPAVHAALDLPFTLLSSTSGEERAVVAMSAGAHDDLVKDNLAQLAPAGECELDAAEARLRQAEISYRTLVARIPAISYIAAPDKASNTLYVSPQIETILGFSPAEWMADPALWLKQLHPRDRDRVLANQMYSQSGGEPISAEFRMLARDGRVVWFRDEAVVVRDVDDQPRYVRGVMFDITERKQAEEALEAERTLLAQRVAERTADLSLANTQLARAARLKDEFLASMSHELRTPLTAILGLSEALQEQLYGPLKEEQLNAIRGIEESGRHLLALINDILALAKIEAGKVELDFDSVSVAAVCQSSLRLIKQEALKKQIRVTATVDETVTTIQTDARRLKQILVNLLANAVKFTPTGGAIGLEVVGDAVQQVVRFTVWDTGIGIAPDDLARLFQPFVQLDSRLGRERTGTGLGLALVERMTELHGGCVAVESAVGVGSRFTVTLPWYTAVEAGGANGTAEPDAAGAYGQRVPHRALIIEDSPTAAEQLSRYLGELGLETVIHPHGDGVIDAVLDRHPDVIILDIVLPASSGWAVLTQLKADPRTRAIPVLVASVVDDRARGLALGAAGYLVKPFARADVQQALRQITPARAERTAQVTVKERAEQVAMAARPTIVLAEDNEANITMLSDYLRIKGYHVVVARNGGEAIAQAHVVRPDLIVMDIRMPGMDGLQATRRIRADADLANIPIIALTALAMPGDRERCLEAGANGYLSKPIRLQDLGVTIAAHLNHDQREQTTASV